MFIISKKSAINPTLPPENSTKQKILEILDGLDSDFLFTPSIPTKTNSNNENTPLNHPKSRFPSLEEHLKRTISSQQENTFLQKQFSRLNRNYLNVLENLTSNSSLPQQPNLDVERLQSTNQELTKQLEGNKNIKNIKYKNYNKKIKK